MNTNFQTIHQMGTAVSEMVRQATGRNSVQSMDMDWVSVEQLAKYIYGVDTGDIVRFDTNIADGIDMLIAYIQYVQDLHGFDNPWPAGGSTNLLPLTLSILKAKNTTGTWNNNVYVHAGITYTVLTDNDGNVIGINANGTSTDESMLILYNDSSNPFGGTESKILSGCPSDGSSSTYRQQSLTAGGTWNTDNGNGVTITGGEGSAIKYCRIDIISGVTVSDLLFKPMVRDSSVTASDFVPYTNVCPITGFTGLNVTRTGKNLLDVSNPDYSDILVSTNGQYATNANFNTWEYTKPGTYVVSLKTTESANNGRYVIFNDDGTVSSYSDFSTSANVNVTKTITLTSGQKATVSVRKTATSIQVEYSNTASAYEAYQGTTYQFTWQSDAGTVYVGEVDVITGILTVTHKSITFTGAEDEDWVYASQNEVAQYHITIDDAYSISTARTPVGCNIGYYVATGYQPLACSMVYVGVSQTSELYYSPPIPYTSNVATFKTWLASNNLQVVYKLAEPETYQLDPQDVTALIGLNVIFSDIGEVSVKYKHKEDVP